MPSKYNVGVITYGKNVHVYEFSTKINTNYCINGVKEYNIAQLMDLIGISVKVDVQSQSSDINKRFIVPLTDQRHSLIKRVKNLRPEGHIYVN